MYVVSNTNKRGVQLIFAEFRGPVRPPLYTPICVQHADTSMKTINARRKFWVQLSLANWLTDEMLIYNT